MSVTFWCPDAPRTEVVHKDVHDTWTESVSAMPEINMSNGNAASICALLGYEDCGTLVAAQMPAHRQHIIRLLAGTAPASAVRETVEDRTMRVTHNADGVAAISMGPRMVHCGIDEDYVRMRLTQLLDLFAQAQAAGFDVSWG
jgi:hypothetical protein